jgi:hypothetical protein
MGVEDGAEDGDVGSAGIDGIGALGISVEGLQVLT